MISPFLGSRKPVILLVEDNEDDALLTRMGFEKVGLDIDIRHVENGADCLAMLRKQPPFESAPTPDLILLDLSLPVLDGREVLSEITRDDRLITIPVVVLTTSRDERDVVDMYKLRCSSYITKPIDAREFQDVVQRIADYWFSIVTVHRTSDSAPS